MYSPLTPSHRNDAASSPTSNEDSFWDAGDFFSPHRTPLDRIRSPSPPLQNIFHPIKNLPWETLARIFIFYYQWTIEDFTRSNQHWTVRRPKPYSWFAIRQVCRLWRNVALNYPFLNTHVVLANPACVADQVARSGQLPLHVYAVHHYRNVRAENMTESCRVVFQHAPRIRSILLQYTPALDSALRDSTFTAVQLPNVERIVTNFGGPGLLQGVPSGKVFPARPFEKTQFESLASCVYERATPSYLVKALHGKPLRHTLQYLEVKDAVTVPVNPSETPTFINTLAQLTELRELILQIKLDRIPPQSTRVTLPHLKLLVLQDVDNTHNASAFLGWILFPPSAKVVIKSMEKDILYLATDANIIHSKYTNGTAANGAPLGLPSFMEIAIYSWPQRVEFSFWQKGQVEKVDSSRGDPPALSWQVDTADDLDDSGDHIDLNMLMERLPVEGIRGVFIILHAKQVVKTDWEKWMSDIGDSLLPLATLQVLGIDGYQIARSVVAAMERARFPRGTMLPRLQQLHIRDTSGRLARSDSCFGHVLERLGKIVIKRRDEGHRLQQLKIETRRTGSDDVDALSRGEMLIHSEAVARALGSLTYSTEVGAATPPINLVTVMAATMSES